MKQGSFETLAFEHRRASAPAFAIPFLGVLQFLWVPVAFLIPWVRQTYLGSLTYPFFFSLGIFVVSAFILTTDRARTPPVALCRISYHNNMESGGSLKLTYQNSKGKMRKGVVASVVKTSDRPLLRAGMKFLLPAKDTTCYMVIRIAQPRVYLDVGFATAKEMNAVYERLS
jgi:hypothetical protein